MRRRGSSRSILGAMNAARAERLRGRSPRARAEGLGERLTHAFGLVLLLLIGTYVLASLVRYDGWGGVFITALGTLAATVALATARATPAMVRWGARASLIAVLLAFAGAVEGGRFFLGAAAAILALLLAVAGLTVLRAVLTAEKVGFRAILGAVSVYIILGLLFTFLYVAVDRIQDEPFFGRAIATGDFLFFSITTLTTTGYGNLIPAGQPGKMFASLEMLIGQIFLVTLIARLVSMWQPGHWLRGGAGIAMPEETDEPV